MSSKTLFSAILLACMAVGAIAAPPDSGPPFTVEEQRILDLPEHEIDIGIAALTFAQEIYPRLDVQAYSKRIDDIAEKVRKLAGNNQDPEHRIRALNTVIFLQEGFRYDHSPDARQKRSNYFLHGILDTRQGICFTMPMLYMAVAQRLNWPIYAVSAPDHVFVRYVDPLYHWQNIEVTSGGKFLTDEHYIDDFIIKKESIESGSYLRPMTRKEYLGELVSANGFMFLSMGYTPRSVMYFEKAIELNPRSPDHHNNLSGSYWRMSEYHKGEPISKEYREKYEAHRKKSDEMGYVSTKEIEESRKGKRS